MKTLTIGRRHLVLAIAICFALFFALSITNFNKFQSENILGFFLLIIVPGLLTVLSMRLKGLSFWGYTGLVVGLSVLELIFMAIIGNSLLPFIGINRPLDKAPLLLEFYFLIGILMTIVWVRVRDIVIPIKESLLFNTTRDFVLAFIPLVFVVMSVFGAILLNNGGSDIITLVMLIGVGIYAAILIYYGERLDPNVIPTALFFISVALLFMTSLRGWFTTGHDIQKEYRVFELTKSNGFWAIANFRDAYNACLSITILPTIFSNLLNFPDPYVYKVFFQIIFALVPEIVYLTIRRYTSTAISFISAFYFVAFPTFFNDMPFLNRQEIAFLFLALMLYLIFDRTLSRKMRQSLFVILGIGMVLSHYSTTYTVVAILIFLVIAQPIARWFVRYARGKGWFSKSAISGLNIETALSKPLIAIWMVLVLAGASFLWSSVLTNTSSGSIDLVIRETLAVIQNNAQEYAQSNDVSVSLLSSAAQTPTQLLASYVKTVVDPTRAAASSSYYSESLYDKYQITALYPVNLPLTPLGEALASIKINVTTLNANFRAASAKLLQILIILGMIFVFFSSQFIEEPIDLEFMLLSFGSLIFLVAMVVLPVLSVEYGLLRAFQQSLMLLGIFVVIGGLALVAKFKKIQIFFASLLVIMFFLSESGVFTQVFGGYQPQLNLNNNGVYYDIYYLHGSELAGIAWLTANLPKNTGGYQSEVQTDRYSSGQISAVTDINPLNDIYPGLIQKGSYVFLGYANVNKLQTTVSYNGDLFTYTYPIQFLNTNKNLIYNNGGSRIYR